MRNAPARWLVTGVAATAVVVLTTGCTTMGLPDSATTQGDEVISVWKLFLVLAAAVSALIWLLTAYVIITSIRRRRSAEATAAASGLDVKAPRQHQYNTRLEIVYTALPLLLVTALLVVSLNSTAVLTDTSTPPQVNVHVIGFQWQWQFQYYDTDIEQPFIILAGDPEQPPTLMLPVGRTVLFTLAANDVIHSFWVPEFLEKRDLIPGVDDPPNKISVFVKSEGEWVGRCAEYCGFNHWLMTFKVKAVPAATYDQWLDATRALPQPRVAGGGTVPAPTTSTIVPITAPPSTVADPPLRPGSTARTAGSTP